MDVSLIFCLCLNGTMIFTGSLLLNKWADFKLQGASVEPHRKFNKKISFWSHLTPADVAWCWCCCWIRSGNWATSSCSEATLERKFWAPPPWAPPSSLTLTITCFGGFPLTAAIEEGWPPLTPPPEYITISRFEGESRVRCNKQDLFYASRSLFFQLWHKLV